MERRRSPRCASFAVFEVKMEILAQYLALPIIMVCENQSWFGRTSPAEPAVIFMRNL